MSNVSSEKSVADLSNDGVVNGVSNVSGLPSLSNEKVRLISVTPFSKYNYSMLVFDVNGQTKTVGLSDSVLLEIIKEKQLLAFKKGFFSQSRQTVPSSFLSALL